MTLEDTISDPIAAQAFDDATDQLWLEQLHSTLEEALGKLPAQQSNILRRRFYQRQTLKQIADAESVGVDSIRRWQDNGLRALRKRKDIQSFVELRTPYYRRWSIQSLERTVEMIAIERERLEYEAVTKMPWGNPEFLDSLRAQSASIRKDEKNMKKQKHKKALICRDAGLVKVPVKDRTGKELCVLTLRPSDPGIAERYDALKIVANEVVDFLRSGISLTPDGALAPGSDTAQGNALSEAENRICAAVDYVFGDGVSKAFFQIQRPFASVNGEFFCKNVVVALGEYVIAFNTKS